MDDEDLKAWFDKRLPVKHKDVIAAAEFLCRNGEEVRARLRELRSDTARKARAKGRGTRRPDST